MIDTKKQRNVLLRASGEVTRSRNRKTKKHENKGIESIDNVEYASSEEEEVENGSDETDGVNEGDETSETETGTETEIETEIDKSIHSEYEEEKDEYPKCLKEIQITFTTELSEEEYQIEKDVYTVPISFKRIDLSRMVKKLLCLEGSNIAFEFMINKKILRTSIGEFLEEHNILSETVLEVEFAKPLLKKDSKKLSDITEWISELIIINNTLYGSSFEGNLLNYNIRNFHKKGKTKISEFPIHCFACCQKKNMGIEGLLQESIFGCSNGTLQAVLQKQKQSETVIKSKVFLSNHDSVINSVAFNKNKSIVISGGKDKKVNIYDNKNVINQLKRGAEEMEENRNSKEECEEATKSVKNRKRKTEDRSENEKKKETKINPQKSICVEDLISISSLDFFDNSQFLCAGLGYNINIFDVTHGNVVASLPHNKSIVCGSIIRHDLFGTSDEHSYINLFDKRCLNEGTVISLNPNQYFFHDKIVTSLKGHKSELYFLTTSHDSYINIYDIRLNKCPVYAIENEDKCKVLSAAWVYEKEQSKAVISADEVSLKMHIF